MGVPMLKVRLVVMYIAESVQYLLSEMFEDFYPQILLVSKLSLSQASFFVKTKTVQKEKQKQRSKQTKQNPLHVAEPE